MVEERAALKPYFGRKLKVVAWLWARTVKSPNPAFADVDVPLVSSFMLSTKKGKEAYVEPVIEGGAYRFTVKVGELEDYRAAKAGTKLSRGANFECLMSGTPIDGDYIKAEGKAGRMGARLMAIVAEGGRGRIYLAPTPEHEIVALEARPEWKPDVEFFQQALGFRVGNYGMAKWSDLFTSRQLVALTTFSGLVQEAHEQVWRDTLLFGFSIDGKSLRDGGTGATAYADAVCVYLGIALSRLTDICNALCCWEITKTQVRHLFGRQAIPMIWDFAENNVFGDVAGDYVVSLQNMAKALDRNKVRE